ncbi:MAG: hypothetical protein KME30_29940 [Iphinoe sp. HA4291-MV1]|jgi:hypothetical protein|nr:hypothetical protein [Iphinoe sp. HA4291-MV1]
MQTPENNGQISTSTNRIKLPVKIIEPIYINVQDLEAIQEEYQARQRERILDVKMRGWS